MNSRILDLERKLNAKVTNYYIERFKNKTPAKELENKEKEIKGLAMTYYNLTGEHYRRRV